MTKDNGSARAIVVIETTLLSTIRKEGGFVQEVFCSANAHDHYKC